MAEQEIEIVENGEYKNLNLKPRPLKGVKGLEYGNYVIVTKNFAEGKPITGTANGRPYTIYSCGVKYKDQDVTFVINDKEHDVYKSLGGVGDRLMVTLEKYTFTNPKTGMEGSVPRLKFELVA